MSSSPDPGWYLDHVLVHARPGGGRVDIGPAGQWRAWWRGRVVSAELADAAGGHGFVLTSAELAAMGVSRQRARTLVRRGAWSSPAPGTIAVVDVRDADPYVAARRSAAVAAAAAVRRRGRSAVSGRSAAILHGLPTMRVPSSPELTALTPARLGRRGGAHLHGARLSSRSLGSWFGVPVCDVARTVVDLARHDRRDGLMAADAALRERLTDPAALRTALADAAGWPGVRAARAVLDLADPRSESPLESLTRLVLHDDGFPRPDLQVQVGGYRVDLLFRAVRLILEVDGLGKYSDDALRREKRRELQLRALGYRVERVGWLDITQRWPETRVWLAAALRLPGRTG